jgi:putative phage-type endonuclease
MRTSGHGDEWMQKRVGCVTASRFADLMAKLKNGQPGASRATYMGEIIAERLTGVKCDGWQSAAMQWGIETEPQAIAAYEALNFVSVEPADFVPHPNIEWAGASPDGYVEDGLVEVKCPNTATHIDTLLGAPIPQKYRLQMQWQMICAERGWCDFVSFDPRMPPHLQLNVERVERDARLIAKMEAEAKQFLAEVAEKVEQLRRAAA